MRSPLQSLILITTLAPFCMALSHSLSPGGPVFCPAPAPTTSVGRFRHTQRLLGDSVSNGYVQNALRRHGQTLTLWRTWGKPVSPTSSHGYARFAIAMEELGWGGGAAPLRC